MAGRVAVVEVNSDPALSAPPDPPSPSRLGVLRHRHYRNIWLGSITSNIGGWMELTGIQWVMTQQTLAPEWTSRGYPSAPVMLGYLSLAQMGPMLFLGLIGGLAADRFNRRRLLLVTQFLLMLTAGALALSSGLGALSPWLLLVIGMINGVTMAFNIPAWQVLTPRLVPRDELTRAITLNGIAFNLARVVGPGLAGVIMAVWHPTVLFVLNTASFLAVILAISTTPDAPAPPRDGVKAWAQTREALRFVFYNKGPLHVFLAMVLFSMLAAPLMRMLPVFVDDVYHARESVYGVMLSVMGLGAVIGGLSLRLVPVWYPKHHLIPLSVLLGGVSIAVWAAISSPLWAAIAIFFCGFFWLWSFNTAMAAIQLLVDDRMRGRVLAVCNTAVFGAMPAGSLAAGYIGHYVARSSSEGPGTQVGVGLLATLLALTGLVMLVWRTPEVDGIAPGEPGHHRRPGLIRGFTAAAHRPPPHTTPGAGS